MKLVYLALFGLALGACAHNPPQASRGDESPGISTTHDTPQKLVLPSTAEINGPSGVHGDMVFTSEGKTIHVVGEFTGLPANSEHGLHVHENGSCDGEKFAGAGSHFNPWKTKHGGDHTKMRHAGDLGNITADAKGYAKLDVHISSLPNMELFGGKSVIVHAGKDDESSQPAGNSGDKIACGLIQQKM